MLEIRQKAKELSNMSINRRKKMKRLYSFGLQDSENIVDEFIDDKAESKIEIPISQINKPVVFLTKQ